MPHVVTRGVGSTKLIGRGFSPGSSGPPPGGPAKGSLVTRGMGAKSAVSRGLSLGSLTPTYPDLVAAVVARLRDWDGGAIATALGGTKKIWSDEAMGSPELPWVRVTEIGETPSYMTGLPYTANGMLQVSLFCPQKKLGRDTGRLIMAALDLAPLEFDDGRAMNFLHGRSFWVPTENVGVGVPTTYHYAIQFDYTVQRSL